MPQQQGGWYGAPGYGTPQQPAPQPGTEQPALQQQGPGQLGPGQPGFGQPGPGQPGAEQPSDQQEQASPRQSTGRVGRVVAVGLLALLLAGGGGVIGGLVVHASDSSNSASGSLAPAPTVDRSTLSGIVNSVKNSVVSIQTSDAEGSGVIFTADGYIVTNNHVVADATGNTVQVTLADSKTVQANIVGTDPKTDLAVVKAQGVSNLTAAKFANSDGILVGDTVLAIGSPLGLSGSVSAGIVSALHRTIEETPDQQQPPQNPFGQQQPQQPQQQQQQQQQTNIAGAIQTDASINPGNSGGALVNTRGEVVGINTSILTADGGDGNGVGFAIPANRVNQVSQELMKGQKVSHPYIGINVGTADGNAGASVTSVVGGSPADKAGLKQGDVIVKADDSDIHSSDDLLDVVQSSKVGEKLQLTVSRNGSTQSVPVTVGESS
jgi:putative serine protease PepD